MPCRRETGALRLLSFHTSSYREWTTARLCCRCELFPSPHRLVIDCPAADCVFWDTGLIECQKASSVRGDYPFSNRMFGRTVRRVESSDPKILVLLGSNSFRRRLSGLGTRA